MLRRAAALVSVVCMGAACGSAAHGGSAGSTGPTGPGGQAWVAGHLPAGLVIVSARQSGGSRYVGYAPKGQESYQVLIEADSPPPAPSPSTGGGAGSRSVTVRGHAATVVTLTDEGRPYGFGVSWLERADLGIYIEAINGPTEADVLAIAQDVRSISEAEWQRLLVEVSPVTHVGKVDPHATPVTVLQGTVGGQPYVLTALVPGGFPLGPDDQRVDCFRLSYAGETTGACPGPPNWARVGGRLFVFGTAGPSVTRLRIAPIYNSSFAPFTVDTTLIHIGPPTRFYVAPLPEGTCSVDVEYLDGSGGLGPTGPHFEAAADYTRCTGRQPVPPGAPLTTTP